MNDHSVTPLSSTPPYQLAFLMKMTHTQINFYADVCLKSGNSACERKQYRKYIGNIYTGCGSEKPSYFAINQKLYQSFWQRQTNHPVTSINLIMNSFSMYIVDI